MHYKQKATVSSLSLALCICIVLSIFTASFSASATVAYNGNGTKESPYLVETPEQLDGMRNNLSAHYKLANTVDMSSFSSAFQPIGTMAKPFTGSFTCELNSDGTPKYIIKNLKIDNNNGAAHQVKNNSGYANYVKNNNKWEAALFGATTSASLENIYVLDAKITSNVLGQHQMNPDHSLNPGQGDEMGTAVLVTYAEDTYISGCGVTGSVTSRANNTGGLVGRVSNCIVENCYSNVEIKGAGFWNQGLFIGSISGGSVKNVLAEGSYVFTYTSDLSSCGGFTGSIGEGAEIENAVCIGTSDLAPFTNSCKDVSVTLTKCYSNVQIKSVFEIGDAAAMYTANDCGFAGNGNQPKFAKISAAQVTAAAESVKANFAYITDGAAYTPGAVSEVVSSESTGTDGTSQEPGSSDSSEETVISVSELVAEIEKLPEAEKLTLKDKDEVKKVKRAFDKLTDAEYNEIPAELVAKMTKCYDSMCLLIIPDIVKRVKALPDVGKLKAADRDNVLEIYDDYTFLDEAHNTFISSKIVSKLKEAYEAVKDMADQSVSSRALTTSEKVIVIILIALIAVILAMNVLLCIYFFRKKRALTGVDITDGDEENTGDEQNG